MARSLHNLQDLRQSADLTCVNEDSLPLVGAPDKEWLSYKTQGYRNLAAGGGLFYPGEGRQGGKSSNGISDLTDLIIRLQKLLDTGGG
jgi:hypothetical protein